MELEGNGAGRRPCNFLNLKSGIVQYVTLLEKVAAKGKIRERLL